MLCVLYAFTLIVLEILQFETIRMNNLDNDEIGETDLVTLKRTE